MEANGNTAALYKYDPYGNPIHASGSLATINPLRYRGYYYDSETGLYYVSSRYYDPEIGRFINADEVDLLGKNGDFACFNLFAYCGNNPITRKDSGGYVWETIFDVLSLGASIMEVAFNPEDPFAWLGLAGDTVDLFPFVTGVGETIRTLKTVSKVADGTDEVIDTYRNLRKFTKGSDLEVHHIVEKRFKKRSEISLDNTDDRLSVVLSKTNHKDYTNAWRNALPYEVTIQKNKYFKQK